MRFSLPGVHLPHRKSTSQLASRPLLPEEILLPTKMHIGAPAIPCVKPGECVTVGQTVAVAADGLSSPVHAGVSGKVKSISPFSLADGSTVQAITVSSDGKMTPCPTLTPPSFNDADTLCRALRDSGIVGLGGAGFPTYAKFSFPKDKCADTLVVNAAECEPYITSDSRTVLERSDDLLLAIRTLRDVFDFSSVVIGIEENQKKGIAHLRDCLTGETGIRLKVLPSLYPQGGEKVLVYSTLGRVIPAGKLPLDVSAVVCNCTTLAEIGRYLRTGMPLTQRTVTVDGGALLERGNFTVPIGTPICKLFEACGGFRSQPYKLLYGGPMMGIALPSADLPVLKNTNAVLALTKQETNPRPQSACIRCGSCAEHCPVFLRPLELESAYDRGDLAALRRGQVMVCMECGCCSYVCPAGRPLVTKNKLSKAALRQAEKEAKKP